MTDTTFALIAEYGLALIALSCFLSCLLVPIPSSLMMLAGGAFAASGDLVSWQVAAAAWGGAIAGDQAGYHIGRRHAAHLDRLALGRPRRAALLARARDLVDRRGGWGVFFSTWLFAPLGPWVNFFAGASRLGWLRFTLWDAAGEAVWVTLYIGLGYTFASNLDLAADLAGNVLGLLSALAVIAVLAAVLAHRLGAKARRGGEGGASAGLAAAQHSQKSD